MDKPKSEYIIDPDSSETGALIMAGVGAKEPHLSSRAGAEEPHPSSSRDEWSPEDEQEVTSLYLSCSIFYIYFFLIIVLGNGILKCRKQNN